MKIPKTLTLLATSSLLGGSSNAALVLQEQFDYPTGPVAGNNGGSGFSDAWAVTGWSRNYDINSLYAPNPGKPGTTTDAGGGLTFPGLPTAGSALSRFGTAGQRAAHRTPSAAALAALTTSGTSIWFSVLTGAPGGNKFGTLVFGTDQLMAQQSAPPFPNGNLNAASGQAFGITMRSAANGSGSGSPNAIAFINSDAPTVGEGSFTPAFQAGATHHDTTLVVGKINWNANGTDDELFLFNITSLGGAAPAEGDAIASLSADFDQSNFDTISLWDTGATLYDEIRFGNTYADVTGLQIPEPSSVFLAGLSGLALILRRRR